MLEIDLCLCFPSVPFAMPAIFLVGHVLVESWWGLALMTRMRLAEWSVASLTRRLAIPFDDHGTQGSVAKMGGIQLHERHVIVARDHGQRSNRTVVAAVTSL